MRLTVLLALMATTTNAARRLDEEGTETDYFCECDCNDSDTSAGIRVEAGHPLFDANSETKFVNGLYHSYACLSDDEIFDILWDGKGVCDESCEDLTTDGEVDLSEDDYFVDDYFKNLTGDDDDEDEDDDLPDDDDDDDDSEGSE